MKVKVTVSKEIEVEIDNKFQAINVPFNAEAPDVPDDIYEECLVAAQMAINDIDPSLHVDAVHSIEHGDTIAEW